MRVLLIDNFDSFTYNLVHYLEQIPAVELEVVRYNLLSAQGPDGFDAIVISPGPGHPGEYPEIPVFLEKSGGDIPVLGVCLGMQILGMVFGAELQNLPVPWHGIQRSCCLVQQDPLFLNFDATFMTGHYHSWAISSDNFPDCLSLLAVDKLSSLPMAIRHHFLPYWGVQFHPESLLTPDGLGIISNFIQLCRN